MSSHVTLTFFLSHSFRASFSPPSTPHPDLSFSSPGPLAEPAKRKALISGGSSTPSLSNDSKDTGRRKMGFSLLINGI